MRPHFFDESVGINADRYIRALEAVVMSWMNDAAAERYCVSQKDSDLTQKTKKVQTWLHSNLPYH